MVEKTSGDQRPLTCSLLFLSSACSSAADALHNTVWTLGCRSYMNSQRAACVCSEEEREELWQYGVLQRQLATSWVFLQIFAAISAQIWGLLQDSWRKNTPGNANVQPLFINTYLPEHRTPFQSLLSLHDSVIVMNLMTLSRLSNEKDIVVGLVEGTRQMLMARTVCSDLQFIKAARV